MRHPARTSHPQEEHTVDPDPCAAIEWSQGITDAWSKVANFVPKFVGCLIILVVGYLVAKTVSKIVDKALERVGFDKAVERGGVKKALAKSQYDASDLVAKVVFYAIFLIVLQMAFGVFGPNPVSDLLAGVIAYLPKVVAAIVIIVVATAIAAAAKELIQVSLGGLEFAKTLAGIAGGAIVAVGFFAALNQLQIAPAIVNGLFYAVLAVVAGSAVIAIGGGGGQAHATAVGEGARTMGRGATEGGPGSTGRQGPPGQPGPGAQAEDRRRERGEVVRVTNAAMRPVCPSWSRNSGATDHADQPHSRRCMSTTSSQRPYFRPTSFSTPTSSNPHARCTRIDASWPPTTRAMTAWNPCVVAKRTSSPRIAAPTP
ncbi:MAG TPA: hypothetical protein VK988_08370 [Acidimicrobiales bacterium]|nr:hypothetical protein [Acidimicrobiales bacterium]